MGEEKIIVLGLSPTAMYVGRESYVANIKCLAYDFKKGPGYHSKYFEKTTIFSEALFLDKLKKELLNNGTTYYVCPTSDEWILFIAKNKDIFVGTNLKTSASYLDNTYNLLADKFRLLKTANIAALNYPNSIVFTPGDERIPDLDTLDFPLFIKPTDRTGLSHVMQGKKGWLIKDSIEWKSCDILEKLIGVELLIQEVIIGKESNIRVLGTLANAGKKQECWVGIKHRQYPHGFGSASLVIETQDNELEDITDALLEITNYSGFFALETKYCDKRGKTYIIEVNTRPGLWFGATTTAGCNFVIQWVNDLREEKTVMQVPVSFQSRKNVVWRYYYKDLFVKFKYSNDKSPRIEGLPKSYAVFDRHDWKPFVFDIIHGLKKIVGL